MQMLNKRLRALIVAACLLAALAFGGAVAWAVGSWWTPSGNTLTVEPTNNAELAEDIAKADVVVDVFQIATATAREDTQAFDYKTIDAFAGLTVPDDPKASDWQKLADDAAALVKTTAEGTSAVSKAIPNLDDGLYLVLAHGRGITDKLSAFGEEAEYVFQPAIVALPSKASDPHGVIRTDDSYGPWLTDITISLKPEQRPLTGSIKITKSIPGFTGGKVTCVFHLVGTTPSGETYDNYAAITCTSGSGETTVTHIPAGTKLTVTEEYAGAGLELAAGDSSEKVIIADSEVSDENPMPVAAFTNTKAGTIIAGSGIENNFELTEDGDWAWTAKPAQSGSGE